MQHWLSSSARDPRDRFVRGSVFSSQVAGRRRRITNPYGAGFLRLHAERRYLVCGVSWAERPGGKAMFKQDIELQPYGGGVEADFLHTDKVTLAFWYFPAGTPVPEHAHPE